MVILGLSTFLMVMLMNDLDQGWEIQDPFYRDIYKRVEYLLRVRNNALHTRVSYFYALKLIETEGGDARLVLPAILLHDTGYSQLPENEIKGTFGPKVTKPKLRRLHEVEGARIAGEILKEVDYPDVMLKKIQLYIDGHDTREKAHDLNDMIVKDADKLWRYSYEGFLLNYEWYDLTPQAYIDRLISKVSTWFFTKTAKKMANEEVEKRMNDVKKLK